MLSDYTEDPLVRLLVDKTRRRETHGSSLAAAHRDIGRILARDVARCLELEECAIEHVTGAQKGVRVSDQSQPSILAILRAGLFLAEGVWEAIPSAALVPWSPKHQEMPNLPNRPVVLVDSVINTGHSMKQAMDALRAQGHDRIVVVTLVAHRPTMEALVESAPDVSFVVARLSERSYVGQGSTDTGARLFGTTEW